MDFTFAKPWTPKCGPVIPQLEGTRRSRRLTQLLEKPELRFHSVQSPPPRPSDRYVTCRLVVDNKPLTISFRTSFKTIKNSDISNEWITLPICCAVLPLSSQIVLTVWDIALLRSPLPMGGSTSRLFGKQRQGKRRLHIWRGVEGDGSAESLTPNKLDEQNEIGHWEKVRGCLIPLFYVFNDYSSSRNTSGEIFRRRSGSINWPGARWRKCMQPRPPGRRARSFTSTFPFDFPLIFSKPDAPVPSTSASVPEVPQTALASAATSTFTAEPHLWAVIDPEETRENPVEDKHRRLVQSLRISPYDRELKPDAKIRDEPAQILNYAPCQPLASEEKDLIWELRFYLLRDKRGLTKFLKSVTWRDSSEFKQAIEELLPQWTELDTDDTLELLGPGTVVSRVRAFVVCQLGRADDDVLPLYLLQLVQVLKFENTATDQRTLWSTTTSAISYDDSGLTDSLTSRGVVNPVF
ncbi:Phosphatidylinositol 3-kinase VPS34 [Mycena kentingensis (nom. inval.)]|nr:Phosphatidylinositol 3-kinase VPS34 [Mycena kentingensis (nom. inval.)]